MRTVEHHIVVSPFTGLPARANAYAGFDGDVEAASVVGARELVLSNNLTGSAPQGYAFVGYDAGYYEGENSHYSLVLNYVLGNRPAGQDAYTLNAVSLIDRVEDAERLIAEWTIWDPANAGDKESLVSGQKPSVFAVYRKTGVL